MKYQIIFLLLTIILFASSQDITELAIGSTTKVSEQAKTLKFFYLNKY